MNTKRRIKVAMDAVDDAVKIFMLFMPFLFLFAFPILVSGQIKKDVTPLRSTCEDVRRVFGVKSCNEPWMYFRLEKYSVEIEFSTTECHLAYGKRWDVPVGTVLTYTKTFFEPISLSEFGLDTKKCEETVVSGDIPNKKIYSCKDDGLGVWTIDGKVHTIQHNPTPKDSCLICKV